MELKKPERETHSESTAMNESLKSKTQTELTAIDESNPNKDDLEKSPPETTKKFIESDAGDGTLREEHYLYGFKLYATSISLFVVMMLIGIDQTITMSILKVLTEEFNATDKVSWISGAFSLGSGISIQIWGKLGIILGRKKCLIITVIIFEIGSLICGLSQSMNMLIAGRTVQGIGCGGIQGNISMIITEIYPINKRSLAFSILTSVMGVSLVIGPFIGGALNEVTWRWCFYINLPIGGVSILGVILLYKPPRPRGDDSVFQKLKRLDYFGILLFSGGVSMFLVGITIGGAQYPWKSATVLCCIIIGFLTFVVYCIWNGYFSKDRLFPLEVLHTFQVQIAFLGLSLSVGALMVSIQFVSLYLELILGKNPIKTGISLLAVVIPSSATGIITGIIINKTRVVKPIALIALVLTSLSTGLLALLDIDSESGKQIGLCFLLGVSWGMCFQPFILLAQLHAPKTPGGTLMSMSYTIVARNIGISVLVSFAQVIYTNVIRTELKSKVSDMKYTIDELINNTSLVLENSSRNDQLIIKKSYMKGIKGTLYFAASCNVLMFCISLFMSNMKIPEKKRVSQNMKERKTDE